MYRPGGAQTPSAKELPRASVGGAGYRIGQKYRCMPGVAGSGTGGESHSGARTDSRRPGCGTLSALEYRRTTCPRSSRTVSVIGSFGGVFRT